MDKQLYEDMLQEFSKALSSFAISCVKHHFDKTPENEWLRLTSCLGCVKLYEDVLRKSLDKGK